jgi:hypothetical protein
MPRKKELISKADFDAITPFLKNVSAERKLAAYQYLVEGKTGAAIATQFNWTRAAVADAAQAVKGFLESYQEARRISEAANTLAVPPGWECVTLCAPTELAEQLRAAVAARAQPSADAPGISEPPAKAKRQRKKPENE